MNAYDSESQAALEAAAQLFCANNMQREYLQMIYDLGVKDGMIMQLRGQIANMEADNV